MHNMKINDFMTKNGSARNGRVMRDMDLEEVKSPDAGYRACRLLSSPNG